MCDAMPIALIYIASGQHPAELPQKDLRIDFENSVQLSPHLTRWLQKMTQPSLEKRFSSAADALCALEKQVLPETEHLLGKPFDSKVRLSKQSDILEIKLRRT